MTKNVRLNGAISHCNLLFIYFCLFRSDIRLFIRCPVQVPTLRGLVFIFSTLHRTGCISAEANFTCVRGAGDRKISSELSLRVQQQNRTNDRNEDHDFLILIKCHIQ